MDTQVKRETDAPRTISLRIAPELYERFTAAAYADHRSIAGEVRHLIEQRVLEHEREAA